MVPTVLSRCQDLLSDEELIKVTSEEYNIYQWPEGELYDTSVIEKYDIWALFGSPVHIQFNGF